MKIKRGNIAMVRALTTKQFIAKAKRIHEGKYNYGSTYYINNRTEVSIICPSHGLFYQRASNHLSGKGCSKCAQERSHENQKKSREQFIEDAIRVHGETYDYSKVDYINTVTKVCIVCLKHGEFLQSPHSHIDNKSKCPKCANAGYSKISIQFLDDLAREWKVDIQHAENKGEYRIDDPDFKCYYKVDGYFERDNKKYVVEFHGDYFHGNPLTHKPDGICKLRRMRFDEIYNKTMERMYRLKTLGYEVIYVWERDYKQYLYNRDNEFFFEGLLDYYKLL